MFELTRVNNNSKCSMFIYFFIVSVVSTLMVLFCGSGKDFRDLWNSSDYLNDPTGTRHEWDLASLIAEDRNFKSSQVISWNSLKYDYVSCIFV